MKTRYWLGLGCSIVLLAGCMVTSVYPFYSAKDVVFEPAIVGNWTNTAEAERWEFESAETNHYRLTFSNKDSTNVIQATLFKLHGTMFMDLLTGDLNIEVQPPPIPSHFLLRMKQLKPTIKMAPMDYDWLGKVLKENPKALRHHLIGDSKDNEQQRLVLTADTAELQAFIVKHLDTAGVWTNEIELGKIPKP